MEIREQSMLKEGALTNVNVSPGDDGDLNETLTSPYKAQKIGDSFGRGGL